MKAMDDIVLLVAWEHGLTVSQVRGGARKWGKISEARAHAMWALRQHKVGDRWRFSTPRIAAYMGLKNHTSVLEQVEKHERRIQARRATECHVALDCGGEREQTRAA